MAYIVFSCNSNVNLVLLLQEKLRKRRHSICRHIFYPVLIRKILVLENENIAENPRDIILLHAETPVILHRVKNRTPRRQVNSVPDRIVDRKLPIPARQPILRYNFKQLIVVRPDLHIVVLDQLIQL